MGVNTKKEKRFYNAVFILFLVALVISAIGFKKFVWFISLGYGFSIAGIGLALCVLFGKEMTAVTGILSVLLIIPKTDSKKILCV